MLRTEDVRDAYVHGTEVWVSGAGLVRREREFDEWLARVKHDAYSDGYDEGAGDTAYDYEVNGG